MIGLHDLRGPFQSKHFHDLTPLSPVPEPFPVPTPHCHLSLHFSRSLSHGTPGVTDPTSPLRHRGVPCPSPATIPGHKALPRHPSDLLEPRELLQRPLRVCGAQIEAPEPRPCGQGGEESRESAVPGRLEPCPRLQERCGEALPAPQQRSLRQSPVSLATAEAARERGRCLQRGCELEAAPLLSARLSEGRDRRLPALLPVPVPAPLPAPLPAVPGASRRFPAAPALPVAVPVLFSPSSDCPSAFPSIRHMASSLFIC